MLPARVSACPFACIQRVDIMDREQLEEFRQRLEKRRQELKRALENSEDEGRAVIADNNHAKDVADQAADSYAKEFAFAQSSSERLWLSMVEAALERLRLGSFGECLNCGKEIGIKRLEAVPWTRYCIDCQEKIERGEVAEVTE